MNTFEEQFRKGKDSGATYTLDFHHVSDYLAAAAQAVAPQGNKQWLHQQRELLRQSQVQRRLRALEPHLEQAEQKQAPVRSGHAYISERKEYMDYAGALAAGLPIGSGEVEGAHRHVLQRRLKIPGAWWLERNAEAIWQLRTLRANGDWNNYWTQIAKN